MQIDRNLSLNTGKLEEAALRIYKKAKSFRNPFSAAAYGNLDTLYIIDQFDFVVFYLSVPARKSRIK